MANRGKLMRRQFVFSDPTNHRRLSLPSLGKSSPNKPRIQTGTNIVFHPLQRRVLKDTGNVPKVSFDSCRPSVASTKKRRASDSGNWKSFLPEPQTSKIGGMLQLSNGCIQTENKDDSLNACSENRQNFNKGSFSFLEKENKSNFYTKAVHTEGTEDINKREHKPLGVEPAALESSILSNETESSNTPCYFGDLNLPIGGDDPSEAISCERHKFFSTPMPSKVKTKKRLTPVMEVDLECNLSEGHKSPSSVSETNLQERNACINDIALQDSPMQTPLYRSFFASECMDIVNHLENRESGGTNGDQRTPAIKRKREDMDVSTIDAEPLPYECTAMQSMLACEVANIIHSMENSPNPDGPSLFGDSILDLDEMNLQLCDFSKLDEGYKGSGAGPISSLCKGSDLNNSMEGIGILEEELDDSQCSRLQQKVKQKSEGKEDNCNTTIDLYVADESAKDNSSGGLQSCNESNMKELNRLKQRLISLSGKNEVNVAHGETHTKEKDYSVKTNSLNSERAQAVCNIKGDVPEGANITQVIGSSKELNDDSEADLDALFGQDQVIAENVTQIIEQPANTTEVSESVRKDTNTTQDIGSLHNAFTTQVTNVVAFANTTQEIGSLHNEIIAVNTTQVIDACPEYHAITPQIIGSLHNEIVNTTHVIETEVKLSPNTTQDILQLNDTTSNSFQDLEVSSKQVLNATHVLGSLNNEVAAANTTHITEDGSKPCTSTTQEIESPNYIKVSANSIPVMVSPQDKNLDSELKMVSTSVQQEITTANTTLDVCVAPVPFEHNSPEVSLQTHETGSLSKVITGDISVNIAEKMKDKESVENYKMDMLVSDDIPKDTSLQEEVIQGLDVKGEVPESCATEISVTNITESEKIHIKEPSNDHAMADNTTLVSTLIQNKQEITRDSGNLSDKRLKEAEESSNKNGTLTLAHEGEKLSPTELLSDPEQSEQSDQNQEVENTHNESVFSCGSLSFITSTPLPGLLNFNFIKMSSGDSLQHDTNVSICSEMEEPSNKLTAEQRLVTQQGPMGLRPVGYESQVKRGINRGSLLPSNTRRSFLPQAGGIAKPLQQTSAIPSARRSLALTPAGEAPKLAREPALSRLPPRGSRANIRPPMTRNGLQRNSVGHVQPNLVGKMSNRQNENTRCSFQTPRQEPNLESRLSSKPVPQIPKASSMIRPSSRLCASGLNRLSMGAPNNPCNVQDAVRGPRFSAMRPPVPSGVRTSGLTSLRPPHTLSSLKNSAETKLSLPGLSSKKSPKVAPQTAKSVPSCSKEALCASPPKSIDTPSSVPSPSPESGTLQRAKKQSVESSQTDPAATKTQEPTSSPARTQSTLTSSVMAPTPCHISPENASSTNNPAVFSGSEFENCSHQEVCAHCQKKIQKLQQELEETRNKLAKLI